MSDVSDKLPHLIAVAAMSNNRVIGTNGALPWHFPEDLKDQIANLEVLMYFPTDAKNDFELKEENWKVGSYEVPGSKLGAGKWIAKIHLESGDKTYYFEPEIVL